MPGPGPPVLRGGTTLGSYHSPAPPDPGVAPRRRARTPGGGRGFPGPPATGRTPAGGLPPPPASTSCSAPGGPGPRQAARPGFVTPTPRLRLQAPFCPQVRPGRHPVACAPAKRRGGRSVSGSDRRRDASLLASRLSTESLDVARRRGIQHAMLRCMVVGVPNVGKSTLINKLAGSARGNRQASGLTRADLVVRFRRHRASRHPGRDAARPAGSREPAVPRRYGDDQG